MAYSVLWQVNLTLTNRSPVVSLTTYTSSDDAVEQFVALGYPIHDSNSTAGVCSLLEWPTLVDCILFTISSA